MSVCLSLFILSLLFSPSLTNSLSLPLSSSPPLSGCRVKLAVCKESGDCVAVKIVTVDGRKEGLSHESLRKEVSQSVNMKSKSADQSS